MLQAFDLSRTRMSEFLIPVPITLQLDVVLSHDFGRVCDPLQRTGVDLF